MARSKITATKQAIFGATSPRRLKKIEKRFSFCTEHAMKKINKQSGQVLIGVAFAMVVLAGFAGLAIDMGTLRYQKRLQQTAADAAAIAGAAELNEVNGSTSWLPAAQAASNQNGFNDASDSLSACTPTADVGTTCVFIQSPP